MVDTLPLLPAHPYLFLPLFKQILAQGLTPLPPYPSLPTPCPPSSVTPGASRQPSEPSCGIRGESGAREDRKEHGTSWFGSHTAHSFYDLWELLPLSRNLSVPHMSSGRSPLSLESPDELPDVLGGSLSRPADPQAKLRAERLGAQRRTLVPPDPLQTEPRAEPDPMRGSQKIALQNLPASP